MRISSCPPGYEGIIMYRSGRLRIIVGTFSDILIILKDFVKKGSDNCEK